MSATISDEGYYEKKEKLFEYLIQQFEDKMLFKQFIKDFSARFIGFEPKCYECKDSMIGDEEIFCEACFDTIKEDNEEFEKQVKKMEDEIDDFDLITLEHKQEMAKLTNEMEELKKELDDAKSI